MAQEEADNLKRKLAELDSCIKDFEAIERVPDDESLKKLKTLTDKLVQTYKTLKGSDDREHLWDNGLSLKLTGFKHGLEPKEINVRSYLKNQHEISVKSSILIHDNDYGKDFVLIEFDSTADVNKALAAELNNFPATCKGGICLFDGKMSKLGK